MNYPLSLLAPARDEEVARAAIQAGADAIYIGAPRFGARQAAGNSIESIQRVVAEAKRYGVQVLATLNTLLKEEEREEALNIGRKLAEIGVDAIIVQDPWLMQSLIEAGIRVHASTQCDNRTPERVKELWQMGCKRVVLARELSIDEIRAIHQAVPEVELEAFIHGALCVSYSGRCYMSEVLCGRSANRGECAQYCRMRYDVLDSNGREVVDDNGRPLHQKYVLSLQDLDRSAHLQEMIDAGITTFKIEGRLKDADYVTNITAYYRRILDRITPPKSVYTYDFVPNPEKTFHRGGINYFLHGRTPHMANFDTPKSTGEAITGSTVLHTGDGICFGDQGFSVNGFRPNGEIIPNKPIRIPKGTQLYRNYDAEFQRHIRAERRIPIRILLEETQNGFRLTIGNKQQEFTVEKTIAQNPERALQTLREQLSKLGNTIYIAQDITITTLEECCPNTFPYFIPIKTINEWRRSVIDGE